MDDEQEELTALNVRSRALELAFETEKARGGMTCARVLTTAKAFATFLLHGSGDRAQQETRQ